MKGEGEGVPAKESILVTVLHKIDEACTWVKGKVKSVFKAFFKFFSKKPEEVLSGNNTQIDNSSEKKPMVQVAPEEGEKVEAVVDDQDASVPAKGSFFVRLRNKTREAWTSVKDKVKSALKLFITESITEALLGQSSWGREVLSGINTQLDNSSGVVPEEGCLLGEWRRWVQKTRKSVDQWLGDGNNLETRAARLTLNWIFDVAEGFIDLLEKAKKQPWTLIPVLFKGYWLYRSYKKAGGRMRHVRCKEKAAMAIFTLVSLIAPSAIRF